MAGPCRWARLTGVPNCNCTLTWSGASRVGRRLAQTDAGLHIVQATSSTSSPIARPASGPSCTDSRFPTRPDMTPRPGHLNKTGTGSQRGFTWVGFLICSRATPSPTSVMATHSHSSDAGSRPQPITCTRC
jgi:hypothetical protein